MRRSTAVSVPASDGVLVWPDSAGVSPGEFVCPNSTAALVAPVLTGGALLIGAAGTIADTTLSTNWYIWSSPWFLRSALVMLIATASIGINASRVVKESAEARMGQRLRLKLLPTSTQK